MLTFAIGDIHGCLDKLNKVLDACWSYNDNYPDMGGRKKGHPKFVFLGDYVDRGPDSKGVIDRILELRRDGACKVITLQGNHEAMMIGSLLYPGSETMKSWFHFGGDKTIESYLDADPLFRIFPGIMNHAEEFLAALEVYHDDGHRFYCHTGVDMSESLEGQGADRYLWGSGCSNAHINPGRYVVHGHIAQDLTRPFPQIHHVNLDTHAYAGGPLSCAVFDSGPFLSWHLPIALICDGVVHELEVKN
jgi:calcineurin-like phosphoesterase family protein